MFNDNNHKSHWITHFKVLDAYNMYLVLTVDLLHLS